MKELEGRAGPTADRIVAASGAVGVGVVATLLLGPILGPLVGAVSGPLMEEASNALRAVVERRATRVQLAIDVATQQGQIDETELVHRSLMDDRRLELLTKALEGAATSDDRRKIRALGAALAKGVLAETDEQLNEQVKIITALAAMDQVDVLVLDQLCSIESAIKRPNPGRKITPLTDLVPAATPIIDSVVARLQNLGVISDETHGMGFGSRWYATEFGRLCIQALRAIEDDAPSRSANKSSPTEP
ncbi:hypothetical protein [Actinophytocola sp. NPDC049390]|uniref:hypothetical protein n=1 Tax=Actinophytocola sp. NPDC049390 TaxID=3363894 RepID=UPI0037BCA4B4